MIKIISVIYHTQRDLLHTTFVRRVKLIKSAPKKDIKKRSARRYISMPRFIMHPLKPEKLTEKV